MAKSAKRVEALTGARALAGLAILFLHFGRPLFAHAPPWAQTIRDHGYIATSFFLMLSGFVLTIAYGRKLADGAIDRRSFNSTPVFFSQTFCPLCRTEHQWFATEAWVQEPSTSAAAA